MKIDFFLSLIFSFLIISFSSCRKSANIPHDQVIVQLYKCSDKFLDAYICFDSLITDSRCPEGAVCIWQGTAIVKVNFHESGNQHKFRMSLKGFPGLGYPNDTVINKYRIVFTDLSPYPGTTHPTPAEESLRASFKISR